MQVLVTYDIGETDSLAGSRRLRRCAQACLNHGQRVQKSVFECTVNDRTLQLLVAALEEVIDPRKDSIRLYRLGPQRDRLVRVLGLETFRDPDAPLII